MKKLIFGSAVCLTLLFSGCIPFLHPLYTADTIHQFDEVVGIWETDDNVYWKMEKNTDTIRSLLSTKPIGIQPNYKVYSGEKLDSLQEAYLLTFVKLNGHVYADFYPFKDMEGSTDFIPTHSIARVTILKDEMTFYYPDEDQLSELFQQGKVRLKHELVEEMGILVTASTKDLQEFIGRYGTNLALFGLENKMTRKAL